jgi:hypothetical protein
MMMVGGDGEPPFTQSWEELSAHSNVAAELGGVD